MINETKKDNDSSVTILGHDYIGRVSEIRQLLADNLYAESIIAISALENDMQVVLTVGDMHDLKDRVLN